MYPIVRLAKDALLARAMDPLPIHGTHVSQHVCWPWDIDPWMELNNGRTLTLYDLGRFPVVIRTGLLGALRRNGWGIVVAGTSIRYRRRIRAFQRFEMRSRCVGWDHRFIYIVQSIWRDGDCSSQVLIRGAITSPDGMVPPEKVLATFGTQVQSPPLPEWVRNWIEAEATRPWPPEA